MTEVQPRMNRSPEARLGDGSPVRARRRRSNQDSASSSPSTPSSPRHVLSLPRAQRRRRIVSTGSINNIPATSTVAQNATTTPTRGLEQIISRGSSEPPQQLPTPSPGPRITRNAVSAPTVPTFPITPQRSPNRSKGIEVTTPSKIDESIAVLIRTPLSTEERKNDKPGVNYVLETTLTVDDEVRHRRQPRHEVIKVGMTKGRVVDRQRALRSKCLCETNRLLEGTQAPIRHFKKAEKLIKTELTMKRHQFSCPGRCFEGEQQQGHTEYFKAERNLVLDITDRWVYFCEIEPWDGETGQLHPFWDERLRRLQASSREQSWARGNDQSIHWPSFTELGFLDISVFNTRVGCQDVAKRWGEWCCYLLGFTVAHFSHPESWALRFFVLVSAAVMLRFTFEKTPFMYQPKVNHPRSRGASVVAEISDGDQRQVDLDDDDASVSTEDSRDCNEEENNAGNDVQTERSVSEPDTETPMRDEMDIENAMSAEDGRLQDGSEQAPIMISDDEQL